VTWMGEVLTVKENGDLVSSEKSVRLRTLGSADAFENS
jgi:hypothetical protein